MKPEQMYQHLKELAEKMGIQVSEHSFRNAGIPVRSGLCKIKGENFFIMDKNLRINKKVELLAECLSREPHEEIYILPAIRDLFSKLSSK